MHVREAEEKDLEALIGLLGVLFGEEEEFSPDSALQRRALLFMFQCEQARVFVVEKEGEVRGMVTLQKMISTAQGGWVGLLEDMVVHPACRGQGLGKALLRHVLEYSRKDGITRITLLTDAVNDSAQAFYSRFHFTRSKMIPLRWHSPSE